MARKTQGKRKKASVEITVVSEAETEVIHPSIDDADETGRGKSNAGSTAVVKAQETGVVVGSAYLERQIELARQLGLNIEVLNTTRIVHTKEGGYKLVARAKKIDIYGFMNGEPQTNLFAYNPMDDILKDTGKGKYNDEARIMFDCPATVEVGEVQSWG